VHRLTQPATPTTTGKVERFHQTLRRDLLADHEPFADLEDVQAALDDWVEGDYNTRRPHRSLEMASPADRFAPVPALERDALPLRLPAALAAAPAPAPSPEDGPAPEPVLRVPALVPGAVEFDRVVPASGNLAVAGKQFWLGPDRAGITVSFWADHDVIHLLVAGARIKSVRSHPPAAALPDRRRCQLPTATAPQSRSTGSCPPAGPQTYVRVRWRSGGPGSGAGRFAGWDGESLAADVVPYRDWHLTEPGPDGLRRVEITGTYWRAYVALEPVGGRFASADEAKAAADVAVSHVMRRSSVNRCRA
jgi:Integrase core domain